MADDKQAQAVEAPKVKLVTMRRARPHKDDGPEWANVHPDEVVNMQKGGWVVWVNGVDQGDLGKAKAAADAKAKADAEAKAKDEAAAAKAAKK